MKHKKFWYLIGIGVVLLFFFIFLSNIISVGERLRSIHIYVEYGFYVLAAILVYILLINPLRIIVFAPTVETIYGVNTISEHFEYDGLEYEMEGKFRKGHFNGVGTIVKKLFEIVTPTNAYFGEKDFQQLQIIRKMVQKNQLPVSVIG